MKHTAFVISANAAVRSAIRGVLADLPEWRITGEAADAAQAVRAATALGPDAILTAPLLLPNESTVPLVHELHQRLPETKIIVLSAEHQPEHFAEFFRCGANGYLVLTAANLASFRHALGGVLEGGITVTSEGALQTYLDRQPPRSLPPNPPLALSNTERAVLHHLAQGLTRESIAREVGLSTTTVERAVRSLYEKLGAATLFQLGAKASELGLLLDLSGRGEGKSSSS